MLGIGLLLLLLCGPRCRSDCPCCMCVCVFGGLRPWNARMYWYVCARVLLHRADRPQPCKQWLPATRTISSSGTAFFFGGGMFGVIRVFGRGRGGVFVQRHGPSLWLCSVVPRSFVFRVQGIVSAHFLSWHDVERKVCVIRRVSFFDSGGVRPSEYCVVPLDVMTITE